MGKNYYEILNIPQSATTEDIKKAYKKQARKFHPDKNLGDLKAEERFKDISEAYEVLSDKEKRNTFDRYGEEGLRGSTSSQRNESSFDSDINFTSGSRFRQTYASYTSGDARETFSRVFSDEDPFVGLIGDFGGFGFVGGPSKKTRKNSQRIDDDFWGDENDFFGVPFKRSKVQDPPLERDLYVSLEEIERGATKKLKITRKVIEPGRVPKVEEKILTVNVKPGWKEGTKVIFSKEGDRNPGVVPADIVLRIKDKPHKDFKRDGDNNIIYTARISLRDALAGSAVEVPTLSGRKITVYNYHQIVQPGSCKRIPGAGLPIPKNLSQRGDLIVKFDVYFPNYLTSEQRQIVLRLLPG